MSESHQSSSVLSCAFSLLVCVCVCVCMCVCVCACVCTCMCVCVCVCVCVFSYRCPAKEESHRRRLGDLRASPGQPHFTGRNHSQSHTHTHTHTQSHTHTHTHTHKHTHSLTHTHTLTLDPVKNVVCWPLMSNFLFALCCCIIQHDVQSIYCKHTHTHTHTHTHCFVAPVHHGTLL